MEVTTANPSSVDVAGYQRRAAHAGVVGRWSSANENLPWRPEPRSTPQHWDYRTLRALALEATGFVRGEAGALRVLTLLNSGHPELEATAGHLYSGLQVLVPGEDMHSHRHSPTAVRFVHESDGGWTAVDGERMPVGPGDVVLTPALKWHEHGNGGRGPVVWQDCTDDPLVTALAASHFELFPVRSHLAPAGTGDPAPVLPAVEGHEAGTLLHRWQHVRAALADLGAAGRGWAELRLGGPHGAPDLSPTVAARFLAVEPGTTTPARRHTGAAVLIVAAGAVTVVVGETTFAARRGDTVAVPSWAWWSLGNAGAEPAVVFAYDETPLMRGAGLHRTETEENR
ncbi:cupin domain-containing protein [Amycolatopsis sp. PS_44_ISF1]|uniref:cupin domain-containing protein n=1 Tax=Amycolatopsis sp. PS_44_ISF1 TaxID=2974917 RepID=UPI0028DDBA53|nr:cupin domain-containing protein [Amycolatopsis sp. PS_44_ISF1]MDT8912383.1 cupin domain-containing protein [Amycolatopsis sp. PS_44_ISF1]